VMVNLLDNLLHDWLSRTLWLLRHSNLDLPKLSFFFFLIIIIMWIWVREHRGEWWKSARVKVREVYLNRRCGSEPQVWSLRSCGLVEFEKKKVGLTIS
jgi:hypothetical protein